MIEVFKTDVVHRDHADVLVERIQTTFFCYTANFDLEDCDRILRVKSTADSVDSKAIILLLRELGFEAEVLADEPEPFNGRTSAYNRSQTVQ
jgi:hypothetical protein